MSSPVRHALAVLALLCAIVVVLDGRGADARTEPVARAPDRGTFTFAPGTHPLDRQAVLQAVAAARPEARALIDRIDGRTTITVGTPSLPQAAGTARSLPDGRHELTLDLGPVSRGLGAAGVARLVLHELGHAVDAALVPADLAARLDALVPAGYPCGTPGDDRSCLGRSAREERFAETFAKWATGDLGITLHIGYKVPPPRVSLDRWGAPLAALARP
ncbi:hypothetical protein [Paraconexibacter algicola]|uniref:Uncharacterized protein n=1 Tax=Paraconexibacter algicola TaxID=2133960 RepID=A0A2T4UK89_9ACTN|nr:hypothetical protein [Paraconexibacter algicola]PTL59672.1 hypothetical protein C7Y72_08430 [Paraconexibacter algicola]